ncbi:MAG: DUF5683 domain-containing protein [bacterium]|nr:DUF5683 domain-containing protein [bacterium]
MFRKVIFGVAILVCVSQVQAQEKKSPALAGCLSFLVPGLGQVYNGQVWRGVGHFAFATLLSTQIVKTGTRTEEYMTYNPYTGDVGTAYREVSYTYTNNWALGSLVAWDIWSIYTAYTGAKKINKERGLSLELKPTKDSFGLVLCYKK